MKRTRGIRVLGAVVTAAIVSGCGIFGPDGGGGLEDQRDRWEEMGISSYSYVFQRLCFCTREATTRVRITVTGGAVTGVVAVETGQNMLLIPNLGWPSIDSLFAIADDALHNADSVTVEYDAAFHFPSSLNIDWITQAADDEVWYTAEGMRR